MKYETPRRKKAIGRDAAPFGGFTCDLKYQRHHPMQKRVNAILKPYEKGGALAATLQKPSAAQDFETQVHQIVRL